ncbi:MAG TPA: lipocalin-like domain-containing protein [Beijerinckiaceae bacterium]|jgi:predicted secreted hydrolase
MAANSKLGEIFSSFLATIDNYYDPAALALIKRAAAASPSPTTVEVAIQLLGPWAGTGLNIPTPPAPAFSFPADHGEHWDTPIEWRYYTLSLDLEGGGRVSVIANFFRKAIATAACAPGVRDLDRQIYSTSMAFTLELPGADPVHHSLPVQTFAPVEGGVEVGNDPFRMVVGKNSIVGGSEVFPLHIHVEDPGDPLVGRPAFAVDVDCAAANPLFLQGKDGYVGPEVKPGEFPAVGWYYYSWPQQLTTGTVTIGGTAHAVASGRAWMDHQWGGSPAPSSSAAPAWSGWCWFEFQFDGDRSLTLACPHQAIVDGKLPLVTPGFGTYVEKGNSQLVAAFLEVGAYTKSPNSAARYPSSWLIEVVTPPKNPSKTPKKLSQTPPKAPPGNSVALVVKPTTVLADQSMWLGGLAEYSEAASTVTAFGFAGGGPVKMEGVGYCEGVGFEDPAERNTRDKTWLRAVLGEPGSPP